MGPPNASDDFEVSIFLTETPTRHSLLYKHKHFRDTTQTKLTSTSVRLTSASREAPIDLDGLETAEQSDDATRVAPSRGDGEDPPAPGRASSPTSLAPAVVFRTEDDDDDVVVLADIPSIDERGGPPAAEDTSRAPKRRRGRSGARAEAAQGSAGRDASGPAYALGSDEEIDDRSEDTDDGLFVTQEDEEDALDEDGTVTPPAKRRRAQAEASESGAEHEETRDDKKKLAMDISYEGFAIYGRVLCLVVKRRDGPGSITSSTSTAKGKGVAGAPSGRGGRAGQQAAAPGGQAVMENWITSTQMPADAVALGAAEAP